MRHLAGIAWMACALAVAGPARALDCDAVRAEPLATAERGDLWPLARLGPLWHQDGASLTPAHALARAGDFASVPPILLTRARAACDAAADRWRGGELVMRVEEPGGWPDAEEESAEARRPLEPEPASPPAAPAPDSEAGIAQASATGSVARAALAPPVRGPFRVQLASYRARRRADLGWQVLRSEHADLLAPLEPALQRAQLPHVGTVYRLQVGPLENAAAAESLCRRLQQRRADCIVVDPETGPARRTP